MNYNNNNNNPSQNRGSVNSPVYSAKGSSHSNSNMYGKGYDYDMSYNGNGYHGGNGNGGKNQFTQSFSQDNLSEKMFERGGSQHGGNNSNNNNPSGNSGNGSHYSKGMNDHYSNSNGQQHHNNNRFGGGGGGNNMNNNMLTPAQQACTRMGHMTRQVGKIRMYNPTKGWGFVLADDNLLQYGVNADIFLHSKHFENGQDLPQVFIGHDNSQKMGSLQVWVSYLLDLSEEKKPQALMVRIEQHDPGVLLGPKVETPVLSKSNGKPMNGGPKGAPPLPMNGLNGSGSLDNMFGGKNSKNGGNRKGGKLPEKGNGNQMNGKGSPPMQSPSSQTTPPSQPATSSKNKGGFTGREAFGTQSSGQLYPQNSAGSSHDENVKMRISFMNTPTNRRNTFLGEDLDLSGLVNNGGANMILTPPSTCLDGDETVQKICTARKRGPSASGSPRGDTTPLPFPDFGHTPMNDDFAGFHPGFFYSTFKMPTFEQVMEKVAEGSNDKSQGGNSTTTSRQRSTGGKTDRETSDFHRGSQTARNLREQQKDVNRMRSFGSVGAPARSTSDAKQDGKQMLQLGSDNTLDGEGSPSRLKNESSQSFSDFFKGKRIDGSPRSPAPPGLEHIRPSFGFGPSTGSSDTIESNSGGEKCANENANNNSNNATTTTTKQLNCTPNSSASTQIPNTPGKKKISKNLENSNDKVEGGDKRD